MRMGGVWERENKLNTEKLLNTENLDLWEPICMKELNKAIFHSLQSQGIHTGPFLFREGRQTLVESGLKGSSPLQLQMIHSPQATPLAILPDSSQSGAKL